MILKIIKSPSPGTLNMIKRRIGLGLDCEIADADAIGLIQGSVIEMMCAADIAEKAVGVEVYDVRGLCPQHMTMVAIFGDTASVADALCEIEKKMKEGIYSDYSQTY